MNEPRLHTVDEHMRKLIELARQVAPARASVLIQGESGTGKELLARLIHQSSGRARNRFVAINCAALPEGLLESELFGFERGSFTGAVANKQGKFELAHNGTFLLDEISEMPLALQAKLLRVLQEGEVERVGGLQPLKINIRTIATTNLDLEELVARKAFRADLYYRLNVVVLRVPPLRQRVRDITHLSEIFIARKCELGSRGPLKLSPGAKQKLLRWSWPGNVRELENVIERAILTATQSQIKESDIQFSSSAFAAPAAEADTSIAGVIERADGLGTLAQMEKQLILKTLQQTENNRTRAAEILGISVRTLRNKLSLYQQEQSHERSV